jgi:hypothetical protein
VTIRLTRQCISFSFFSRIPDRRHNASFSDPGIHQDLCKLRSGLKTDQPYSARVNATSRHFAILADSVPLTRDDVTRGHAVTRSWPDRSTPREEAQGRDLYLLPVRRPCLCRKYGYGLSSHWITADAMISLRKTAQAVMLFLLYAAFIDKSDESSINAVNP